MKKSIVIFISALFLSGAALSFAADTKPMAAKPANKTVFSAVSDYFAGFNKPFMRPGNKQNIWNATADWIRHINKE